MSSNRSSRLRARLRAWRWCSRRPPASTPPPLPTSASPALMTCMSSARPAARGSSPASLTIHGACATSLSRCPAATGWHSANGSHSFAYAGRSRERTDRTDHPFGRATEEQQRDVHSHAERGYASSRDRRVNCGLRSADRRGRRAGASGECSVWGAQLTRRPLPAGKLLDDDAQFAQTRQGLCQRCRRRVRPQIPGLSPGGLGPHLTSSGFPCGLSSGFPVARRVLPLRPPFSGFPSSGVLRFVPFGRCPVPVPPRFPSGFPFPWAMFTLALPRGGSAGVGPRRQGPRSPALPRPPRLDRAIRPHCQMGSGYARWVGCRHRIACYERPPSDGHRRARTAHIG